MMSDDKILLTQEIQEIKMKNFIKEKYWQTQRDSRVHTKSLHKVENYEMTNETLGKKWIKQVYMS